MSRQDDDIAGKTILMKVFVRQNDKQWSRHDDRKWLMTIPWATGNSLYAPFHK